MALGTGLVSRLLELLGGPAGGYAVGAAQATRPLQAVRFVALDLETTGLDHRRDAVVQIAMVGIDGLTVAPEPILYTRVNPQRPIPPAATRIHGIADADVRDAPTIALLLPEIARVWQDAVIVGHHVRFDLGVLATAAHRNGHALARPAFLDTWALAGALDPRLAHLDIADVARRFDIDAEAFTRHDALADARLAAHLFVRLADRLIATGHATVGQAVAFAERHRLPR